MLLECETMTLHNYEGEGMIFCIEVGLENITVNYLGGSDAYQYFF